MEIPAYAMINLTFEVLGKLGDGYHSVTTVMQTIALADKLRFELDPHLKVDCEYEELSGEQNLVWQAAVELAKVGRIDPEAKSTVEKHMFPY